MNWYTENLQFVFFTNFIVETRHIMDFWSSNFGSYPENYSVNPQNPNIMVASGRFQGANLRLQTMPGRVDMFISLNPNDEINLLEKFQNEAEEILDVVLKFSDTLKSITRIAFVTQLMLDVKDINEGNKLFLEKTEFKNIPDDVSDLNFSINLKQIYSDNTLSIPINRLIQWSTQVKQVIQFTADGTKGTVTGVQTTPFFSVNIDLNTVPIESSLFLLNEHIRKLFNYFISQLDIREKSLNELRN